MRQGETLKVKNAFLIKGSRGRPLIANLGDIFIVTSPAHMNKETVKVDRKNKAKINSGYRLTLQDLYTFFEIVEGGLKWI